MKIVNESILFFSRVSLLIFSLKALTIFHGYEGYLYLCVFGMRRVSFFQNRASWRLGLMT